MSTPHDPAQPNPPAQPALPDLSEFIANPGKPPREPKASGSRSSLYTIGAVVGVVLLGAGYAIGHYTASGPTTLVAAVADAQAGKLPCGTPSAASAGGTGAAGGNASSFLVARLCQNTGSTGAGTGAGTGTGTGTGTGGFRGGGGFGGGGGALGGLFGPGAVSGTIASVGNGSLSLTTRAGTVTITIPSTAKVTKTTAGALSDLANGQSVVVSTTTSGTSRTATSIFVLPAPTTTS